MMFPLIKPDRSKTQPPAGKVYTMFQYMNDLFEGKDIDQDGYVLGYFVDFESLEDEHDKIMLKYRHSITSGSAFVSILFSHSIDTFISRTSVPPKDIYAFAIPVKDIATIPQIEEYLSSIVKSIKEVAPELLEGGIVKKDKWSLYEILMDSEDLGDLSDAVAEDLESCKSVDEGAVANLALSYMDFDCSKEEAPIIFEDLKESFIIQELIDQGAISEDVESFEDFLRDLYIRNGKELINSWTIMNDIEEEFGKSVIPIKFLNRHGYFYQYRDENYNNRPRDVRSIEIREITLSDEETFTQKVPRLATSNYYLGTTLSNFENSDWLGLSLANFPKKYADKMQEISEFQPNSFEGSWHDQMQNLLKEKYPEKEHHERSDMLREASLEADVYKSKQIVKLDQEIAKYLQKILAKMEG